VKFCGYINKAVRDHVQLIPII